MLQQIAKFLVSKRIVYKGERYTWLAFLNNVIMARFPLFIGWKSDEERYFIGWNKDE